VTRAVDVVSDIEAVIPLVQLRRAPPPFPR
jgi:hypothetical protein